MNLRQKTFIIITTTYLGILIVGFLLAQRFFMDSFRQLEKAEITKEIQSFHYQLDHELEVLSTLTNDWAVWDDSYEFIATRNQDFIQSNLVESTYHDLGLLYVIYINTEGHIVYGSAYDPINEQFQEIDSNTRQFFQTLSSTANNEIIKGYYPENGKLILFSANPVLDTLASGPSRGFLVFARSFDGLISDHIGNSLQSDFTIFPFGTNDLSDFSLVTENSDYLFNVNELDTVKFISFIKDDAGNPIFEVFYSLPRTIYQRGLTSMRELLLSVAVTGLVASIISLIALENGFLCRISRLTDGVRSYDGHKEGNAELLLLGGNDELSRLSSDVHTALVNLSQTRDDLAKHLDLEKLLVSLTAKFINLPVEQIDPAISQVLEIIGKFAGVDRSYLLRIRENEPFIMDKTHEWCSPNALSISNSMQDVDLREFNWWHEQMKSGKSLLIDDIMSLPAIAKREKDLFAKQSIQSIANIPLFVNERLAGLLGFDTVRQKIKWSDEITILLEVVASILSNALDRQQHEKNLSLSRAQYQRRSEELDALQDTITDMTSEREINNLLHTILERSIKLLNADGGDFCVYEEEENILKVVAVKNLNKKILHTRLRFDEGAAGKAAVMRETLILDDYSTWEGKMGKYAEANIRSAMVSPLIIGDRLLGTVGIFSFSPEKRFSAEDQKLLSMFAQHASIALDNAMLFEKIQELARIDEVTGLLNRRSFTERAEYEINRARRLKNSLGLAMIDLDGFKQINDQFSHQVGDQVLKEVSYFLQKNIRNIDIIGRYGGDEVMILMPETTPEDALAVLERLRARLAAHKFKVNEEEFSMTASIGLALCDLANSTLEEMIRTADEAMYRAKNYGKNMISQ